MRIFYLTILLSVIFSQSSSLSLYGVGEKIYSFDANSIGIGNSRLFTSNTNGFTLSSPSTYYHNTQANLSMSMSFNKVTSNKIEKLLSNNFHHLSFGFPISDKQYFMLSMNPKFRSNIILREDFNFIGADQSNFDFDNDGEDDPLKYRNIYNLSGGISEISSSISSRINDKISLGFKVGKLFGTSTMEDSLYMYAVDTNIEGNLLDPAISPSNQVRLNKYNYSSFTYALDMKFNLFEKNILAFYFEQSSPLNIKLQSFHKLYGVLTLDYEEQYKTKEYNDYVIGFQSNVYNNFGYILEFQKYDAFNSLEDVNILNNSALDMISYNAGIFMIYNDIPNANINSINLNLGFYDRLFKINNNSIGNDLAFTFGIGIEYLNDNSFALSLESGKRHSEYNEFKDEKYYKLTLSFMSNSMWFIKEGE